MVQPVPCPSQSKQPLFQLSRSRSKHAPQRNYNIEIFLFHILGLFNLRFFCSLVKFKILHYLTNSGAKAAKMPPPAINMLAKKKVGFLPNLSVKVPKSKPPVKRFLENHAFLEKSTPKTKLILYLCAI